MTTLQHQPPGGKVPIPRRGGAPIVVRPPVNYMGMNSNMQKQSQIRIQTPQGRIIQGIPGGRMPLPGGRLPLPGGSLIRPGGKLPLPANLDDVQCDFCSVKLPRSIIHMHMKMRHSELMQKTQGNVNRYPSYLVGIKLNSRTTF